MFVQTAGLDHLCLCHWDRPLLEWREVAKHLFSSGWLGLWIYANLRMSNSIAQMNDFGLASETLQSCGIVVTDVILQNSWLLYHKAMLSYTSATIATALRRCPFFQPLLNAIVLLHAADNRLQRSSHIFLAHPKIRTVAKEPSAWGKICRHQKRPHHRCPERSYLIFLHYVALPF